MKKIFWISIFLITGYITSAKSSYDYDVNCVKAHYNIMCLRFNDARQIIDQEKKLKPSNDIPYLLDDYIDFLTLMVGEQESDFKQMKPNLKLRIERLEKGDKNSPWYRYILAETYMHWSFTRAKFGEYVTSAIEINKAYRLLEENNKLFPSFMPNKQALGILHIIIGSVPVNYQWLVKIMSFHGTINQGVIELNEAFESTRNDMRYHYLLPESIILLSYASINLSNNKTSAINFSANLEKAALPSLLHESPLICYAVANMKSKLGQNDEAITILENRPQGKEYYPFYYLEYLLGIAKQNRMDAGCYYHFITFAANFKGINYIKSAYQRIAWYYLIKGDMENYSLYLNRILLRGGSQVDNDKQALTDARKHDIPDIHLLKARLLFDGGYYQKALAEVNDFDYTRSKDPAKSRLEYFYRTGRIYHEWGKDDMALDYYQKTMDLGRKSPWYFAANASLNMGYIYESRHEYEKARQSYKKCLDLEYDEYKTSLSQKAKAGLSRLAH